MIKIFHTLIAMLFVNVVPKDRECCNFDCNQGRDCVKRKRRSD